MCDSLWSPYFFFFSLSLLTMQLHISIVAQTERNVTRGGFFFTFNYCHIPCGLYVFSPPSTYARTHTNTHFNRAAFRFGISINRSSTQNHYSKPFGAALARMRMHRMTPPSCRATFCTTRFRGGIFFTMLLFFPLANASTNTFERLGFWKTNECTVSFLGWK